MRTLEAAAAADRHLRYMIPLWMHRQAQMQACSHDNGNHTMAFGQLCRHLCMQFFSSS